MPLSPSGRALTLVASGAAAISFAPIFVKALFGEGMAPTPIAAWRVLIATAILAAIALIGWRRLTIPRPALRLAAIGGLLFAADLFVWHWSIVYVGAGMATILGNTQVFWTAALVRVIWREPLTGRFAAGAIMAFAGVVLLAGVGSSIDLSGDYLLGVGLGLATGVVYAGYIVSLRQANVAWAAEPDADELPAMARAILILGWTVAFSTAGLWIISAIEGGRQLPSDAGDVGLLIGLAIVVQILGWLIISWAMPRVAAARAALVILLQPTLATTWGAIFFGEELTVLQLVGAGLTLTGVYFGSTRSRGS